MRAPKEQFLVDEDGRKTAVVLSVSKYRKLLEDLHDLAVFVERQHEDPIGFLEMKRRLKANALL
jgi:hypothetical protein